MAAKSIVSLEKSLEESVEREKRLKLELKTTLAKIKDSVGSQPSSSQCVINAGKDHEETLSHLIDLVEKDNNMTQEKDLGNLYKFKSSKRLRRQTEKKPAGISSSSSTTRSSVVISRKSPPLSGKI